MHFCKYNTFMLLFMLVISNNPPNTPQAAIGDFLVCLIKCMYIYSSKDVKLNPGE